MAKKKVTKKKEEKKSGFILSLIGLVCVLFMGFLFTLILGIIGLVLSIIQKKDNPNNKFANAGFIMGIIAVGIGLLAVMLGVGFMAVMS